MNVPGPSQPNAAYWCDRCGHPYRWRGGISFGAVCELGRLVREHYAAAHPDTEVGQ
jgi:hypothetical protein